MTIESATSIQRQQLATSVPVARWQKLIDNMQSGVVLLDGHGRVEYCNAAGSELLGEPLLGELWLAIINRAFAPRDDDGHEVSLKDGRRVRIETQSLAPESGQLLCITDLTETRALQNFVNHRQRLAEMGEMAAQMAHQIRTPLATAILYANHLKNPQLTDAKHHNFVGKVLTSLQSLEQHVKDMLLFVKGSHAVFEEVSLKDIIATLRIAIEDQIEKQQAKFTIKNQFPHVTFQANRDALVGALHNLVTNALQACRHKPEIELIIESSGEYMFNIVVSDNGCGMDTETQGKVLQPFFTTKEKGTGLGLAVVQAVAKAHRGDVWIKSKKAEGTQVAMQLPGRIHHDTSTSIDS